MVVSCDELLTFLNKRYDTHISNARSDVVPDDQQLIFLGRAQEDLTVMSFLRGMVSHGTNQEKRDSD